MADIELFRPNLTAIDSFWISLQSNVVQFRARVFYCSIGHELDELKVPQVTEIIRRGAIWAAS